VNAKANSGELIHEGRNVTVTRRKDRERRAARVVLAAPRIFLRSNRTGEYLDSHDDWRSEVAHARGFSSALDAELHCRNHRFIEIDLVVLREGKPPLIVSLALP
jgi:hypothetical protein